MNKALGVQGVLSVRAFSGATAWNHRPVEVGTAADVLGTDAHYAATYARSRYDDLATNSDANGASLTGVFQDPTWVTSAAARAAASDAVIAQLSPTTTTTTTASLTDTVGAVQLLNAVDHP